MNLSKNGPIGYFVMAMRFAEMKKMYAALTDRLLFEPKTVRNGTEEV
jgi:hypothetical protein